jgi:hypothetical protein
MTNGALESMDENCRAGNSGVPPLLQSKFDKISPMAPVTVVRREFRSECPGEIASM